MSIGAYGILIIFGLFIVLLVINPNMSCFGRRIKSPFYPLTRKKNMKKRSGGPERKGETEDYGFHLDP